MWLAAVGTAVILECAYALAETPRSWALLVLAAVLFVAGAAYQLLDVKPTPQGMDVSAWLATAAIAVAAFAAAGLLSGQPLAYAWAAEAAALAWTGRRLRAPHLQALALAPLGLALGHVLAIDAPPRQLLVDVAHPAQGALTALAFAAAAGVGASQTRAWRETRTYAAFAPWLSALVRNQHLLRSVLLWATGLAATYTLSLGTLARLLELRLGLRRARSDLERDRARRPDRRARSAVDAAPRRRASPGSRATTCIVAAEGFALLERGRPARWRS